MAGQPIRRRYGIADVRTSYTAAKRQDELDNEVAYFLIYRPVSVWLTPPLLALGIPATAVTGLSLLLALAMPLAALEVGARAYLAVGLLAVAVHVLDCLDGNIARTSGKTSAPGALFDGFTDHAFWVLYFATLGLLVDGQGASFWGGHGLHVSLGLILLVMLNRELRDAYSRFYGEEIGPSAGGGQGPTWFMRFFISAEGFYGLATLLAGALGALPQLLAGIAVYVVLIFVTAVVLTFRNACRRPPPETWHGR